MAKKVIDWDAIKTEYITTGISHLDIAKKYGVSRSAVGSASKREGWVKQREAYHADCVSRASRKTAIKETKRLEKLMNATSKAVDAALKVFDDEQQFNRYIITEGVGGGATLTEERIYAKVDTKALKELTGVIKDLTALMREFYNIPTPAQAEAQRIAAERLELDRKKAETNETTADTTLELIGIPEEYMQ